MNNDLESNNPEIVGKLELKKLELKLKVEKQAKQHFANYLFWSEIVIGGILIAIWFSDNYSETLLPKGFWGLMFGIVTIFFAFISQLNRRMDAILKLINWPAD